LDFGSKIIGACPRPVCEASKGALTAADRGELEEYVRVGHQLAMLQSKARQSLKRHRFRVLVAFGRGT
jgi:hypothetical protein